MRTDPKLAFAALLAASVSTAVFAQLDDTAIDPLDDTAIDPGIAPPGEPGIDPIDDAAISSDVVGSDLLNDGISTYGDLTIGLETFADRDPAATFGGVDPSTQVDLVGVSDLEGTEEEIALFDEALYGQSDLLTSYREEIARNDTLRGPLETEGYRPDQVVSWREDTDGSMTLYVDDRM